MDSIAPGLCTHINNRIAGATRLSKKQIFFFGDAQSQSIDKRILRVARFETNFSAYSGHPKRISVAGHPANDAVEDAPVFCDVFRGEVGSGCCRSDRSEAQRIQNCDGPRAHGENIAQNTANAGRRPLKGFYKTGVIVGFDFERSNQTVADIDNTGVFARALNHLLAANWQPFQVNLAGFIGAVFAPHHAENPQLRDVRVAAQDLLDTRVFRSGKAVLRGDFRRDSYFHAYRGQFSCLEISGLEQQRIR